MPSLINSEGSFSFPYTLPEVFEEAIIPHHVLAADLSLIKLHYDEEVIRQGAQFRAQLNDINLPFSVKVAEMVPYKRIALHGSKFGLADVKIGIDFESTPVNDTNVNYRFKIDLGRIGLGIARTLHAHEKAQEDSHVLLSGIFGSIHRAIEHRRAA
jgi:hypothetical protein